jgi:hypothetical protein
MRFCFVRFHATGLVFRHSQEWILKPGQRERQAFFTRQWKKERQLATRIGARNSFRSAGEMQAAEGI